MKFSRATMDPFNLQRFVDAQRDVFEVARAELSGGRKRSHWMWFIFPQIAGLGSSPTSQYYAISSLKEADAYLAHPLLGQRLIDLTDLVCGLPQDDAVDIFGEVDAAKFRSSMTLFSCAHPSHPAFNRAIAKYFQGEPDSLTLQRIGRSDKPRMD
jgi:uncharacterized protein (DUF1810 family)